jgi:hypothetical protein
MKISQRFGEVFFVHLQGLKLAEQETSLKAFGKQG